MISRLQTYLIEAVAEIRKVIWPNRKQTINYTILVVIMSVGMALFFGILDFLFSMGLESII